MKVLLVDPPVYRFAGLPTRGFPLGLGYIAALLRKEGHTVSIYNANIGTNTGIRNNRHLSTDMANAVYKMYSAALQNPEHEVWLEIKEVITEFRPDVLGITCRVLDIMSVFEVAEIAKLVDKNVIVVLGGAAATTCTDMLLEENNIDIIVRGEGEITMVELLKELQRSKPDLHSIDGISFRNENGIVEHNKRRDLIADISTLPFPAKDLLLMSDKYSRHIFEALMGDIITSRGCPSACTFCANYTLWGSRKFRSRTPQDVLNEIVHLKEKYGIQNFIFWDDNFTLDKQRAREICQLLIDKNVNVSWLCLVRANTIDIELLKLMKRAGCFQVQLGVESGSDRILKKMKKGVTKEQIRSAAKLIKESGMPWLAFFIIGFPGETKEEMKDTIRFLYELKPGKASLSVFAPYPGTPVFLELKKNGVFRNRNWELSDNFNIDDCYTDTMGSEEFHEIALEHLRIFDDYNYKRDRLNSYCKYPILTAKKIYNRLLCHSKI